MALAQDPLAPAPVASAPLPDDVAFFASFRARLRLSLDELAARLRTQPETLDALETGAALRLPPWPEVMRVVQACAEAARVDAAPLLDAVARRQSRARREETERLLRQELQAVAAEDPAPQPAPQPAVVWAPVEPAPLVSSSASPATQHWAAAADISPADRRDAGAARPALRRGRSSAVRWVLPLASAAVLMLMALPPVSGWLARHLPAPVGGFVRSAADGLTAITAPQRDGLRWIEVEDPRSRRGDKLPAPQR